MDKYEVKIRLFQKLRHPGKLTNSFLKNLLVKCRKVPRYFFENH